MDFHSDSSKVEYILDTELQLLVDRKPLSVDRVQRVMIEILFKLSVDRIPLIVDKNPLSVDRNPLRVDRNPFSVDRNPVHVDISVVSR